jgi:hypothetical protein
MHALLCARLIQQNRCQNGDYCTLWGLEQSAGKVFLYKNTGSNTWKYLKEVVPQVIVSFLESFADLNLIELYLGTSQLGPGTLLVWLVFTFQHPQVLFSILETLTFSQTAYRWIR